MKPYKIGHITTVDTSLRFLLLNQLVYFKNAGFDVAGLSAPGKNVDVLESKGIRHIGFPISRRFTPIKDLLSMIHLYRIIKQEQFTIVHTHTPKPGLIGQLASRFAGVPIVINTIHGFYFHEYMNPTWRKFYIALEKIAARSSDVILSQNHEDVETAIKVGISDPHKIKYLGNGIDLSLFDRKRINTEVVLKRREEFGLTNENQVVGFVGRLVKEKGIVDLMRSAAEIIKLNKNVRFLIIGNIDRDKADAITPKIAEKYGIEDLCIFTGRRLDLPELYALMNVFVLPSYREGFPRSPMEASAMGVPVVVTDIRGCREVVEQNRNGKMVPLSDVKALTAAISMLLVDSAEAQRMGQEGIVIAKDHFDERVVFKKVLDEYTRQLIEKGFPVDQLQLSQ